MTRTIKVTGKGKISVKPDMIRLTITQTALEPEYEKAIKESADKKEYLNNKLQELGFVKKDLKVNNVTDIFNQTIKFFIDQNIEYKSTKNSKDYKKFNSLSFDLRDEYTINTESKNFSYPNIQIISYRFKGETRKFDNYIIFFTIVAPKEYKKYIS